MALNTSVGATLSTTSGFSTARYAQQIRKEMLNFGPLDLTVWRDFADVGKLQDGHTNIYQVNRRRRLKMPLAGATEGTPPAAVALDVDDVQGTATQYVYIISFTDVNEIYAFHDLLEDATIEIKDVMQRLDAKIMSDSYVAATNIIYPGSISGIATITASDILNTNMIRRAVAGLQTGDHIFGSAMPFSGGEMTGIISNKAVMDLQQDPTWDQYASRMRPELLEKGIINVWMGVQWRKTNFIPEYTNLGTTESAVGCSSADSATAGSYTGVQTYVVTRKSQFRTFEEGISGVLTTASLSASHSIAVTLPTDSTGEYVYNVYTPSASGGATLKLAAANQASGTVVTVSALPTGVVAPVAPASGVTVIPAFIFGKGAVSTVDLAALEIFITPRVSTPSDPAVQNRYVAAKFFLGSFLQQNAWIRQLYSATSM